MTPDFIAAEAPMITDWISAGAAAATTVVAVLALIYAKGQIGEARKARQQARDLADEIAQPYVVVYTEPSEASERLINIVVKNFGQTGARDVQVAASPSLRQYSASGPRDIEIPALPFLAPGQEWRRFWDDLTIRSDRVVPDKHTVVVTYSDSSGKAHQTTAVLDWRVFDRQWVEVTTLHDVGRSLKKIEETVSYYKRKSEFDQLRGGDMRVSPSAVSATPEFGYEDGDGEAASGDELA
ncbi:hypothetical protein [Prescottella equi]|uniref:hypothetical protein n=1 Tax=Rhodococcus hoagii TaxID=43767 RepID=UPI001EEC83BC|nr:hypothetical protein [Prescottella equi]